MNYDSSLICLLADFLRGIIFPGEQTGCCSNQNQATGDRVKTTGTVILSKPDDFLKVI
jgi:hypothetical protein